MPTSYFSSTQLFQDFLGKFHSRKLLIHNPLSQQPPTSAPPFPGESSLDKNVIIVLSVLVCTIICTIILNFVIRRTLSCLRFLLSSGSTSNSSPRKSIDKGIKQTALKTFAIVKYSAELKLPGLDTECVICLSDFSTGERVRILPKCNHGFHVRCIDKWLRSNSSCPKCRHYLIETCEKTVGRSSQQASFSTPISLPVQETVASIVPLEHEGVVHNMCNKAHVVHDN